VDLKDIKRLKIKVVERKNRLLGGLIMRTIIKLLAVLLISFTWGYNLKIDYSSFSDGTSYFRNAGASYTFLDEDNEYSIRYSNTLMGNKNKDDFYMGADWMTTNGLSPFMFIGYSRNEINDMKSVRTGVGIAALLNDNVLHFPFRHKFSVALIEDSKVNGTVVSWRHKFKGYYNKFGWNLIAFHLGYTWNIETKLSYKLNKNINVIYKDFRESYNGFYQAGSIGVEINL